MDLPPTMASAVRRICMTWINPGGRISSVNVRRYGHGLGICRQAWRRNDQPVHASTSRRATGPGRIVVAAPSMVLVRRPQPSLRRRSGLGRPKPRSIPLLPDVQVGSNAPARKHDRIGTCAPAARGYAQRVSSGRAVCRCSSTTRSACSAQALLNHVHGSDNCPNDVM